MNKHNFCVSVFLICLIFLGVASLGEAKVVVVDPGHNGDEQNRGGQAFTVDFLGSELAVGADTGSNMIQVDDASLFSTDTEPHDYTQIKVGGESLEISGVNYATNIINLENSTSEQHFAGEDVTVQNFRIQAIGQPNTLMSDETTFDTLTYTHRVSADDWDSYTFKTDSSDTPLGLLEVLNSWDISTRLKTELEGLGHTVHLTKDEDSGPLQTVLFEDRAKTVDDPDLFISIHTNSAGITLTSVNGTEYVPYRTPTYPGSPSGDPQSTVWSPSHGFEVEWFVPPLTLTASDTPAAKIKAGEDTQVLIPGRQYVARFLDSEFSNVDPFTILYRVRKDGSLIKTSTLPDSRQTVTGAFDRQDKASVWSDTFSIPTDTGPSFVEMRGPFQADQQDSLGIDVVDQLETVVAGGRHGAYDVNCSDPFVTCDLALGSWLADIRDEHDPAFVLSEVGYHTGFDDAEFFVDGGFQSSAEKIATAIDNFTETAQDDKWEAGKESDRIHPFEIRDITFQSNIRNEQTNNPLGSTFNVTLEGSSETFSGTAPGNKRGVLITPFDTGTYDATITQTGNSTGQPLECPGDWSTFYETRDTGPVDLTSTEFDGSPMVRHDFFVWPQGRFSGTVTDSSGVFLDNATVKVIPEGNNDTQLTSPNAPPPGQSHGSYHFCGIDQTDVDADPPTSYTITASLDGYFSDTITGLTMTSDTIVRVDTLVLGAKPGDVHGSVFHAVSNDPLSNVNHDLKDDTGNVIANDNSWQGDFEFLDVDPGDYDIVSSKSSATVYVTDTTPITINPGDSKAIDIPLTGYNDIRVHVTKQSNGSNAQGVSVTLKKEGTVVETKNTGYGGSSGIARFRDYEPDKDYTVEVTGDQESITPLPESDFPDGEGTSGTTCGVDDCVQVDLVFDDT